MKIDCICPPKNGEVRHPGGDIVSLRERLEFHGVLSIKNDASVIQVAQGGVTVGEYLATLTEGYLVHGIESWSVQDDKGKPVPVTRETVTAYLLEGHQDIAMEVGEAADELYAEQVTNPLLEAVAKSSQPSSTDESTSPTTGSTSSVPTANRSMRRSQKSAKPSKPSSITSIPTASTAATSSALDGDSSLSPSSVSAA